MNNNNNIVTITVPYAVVVTSISKILMKQQLDQLVLNVISHEQEGSINHQRKCNVNHIDQIGSISNCPEIRNRVCARKKLIDYFGRE